MATRNFNTEEARTFSTGRSTSGTRSWTRRSSFFAHSTFSFCGTSTTNFFFAALTTWAFSTSFCDSCDNSSCPSTNSCFSCFRHSRRSEGQAYKEHFRKSHWTTATIFQRGKGGLCPTSFDWCKTNSEDRARSNALADWTRALTFQQTVRRNLTSATGGR